MPVSIATLIADAEALLDAHAFQDYCPIGVQVHGHHTQVETLVSAVSCTHDVFERAAAENAQLVLVHHGLFWRGMSQVIDPIMRERLRVLFDAGITLAGYHLPLDAHPTIGNNALLADELELRRLDTPFAVHGGRPIGVIGEYASSGIAPDAFTELVTRASAGRTPLVLGTVAPRIRRVAVCSGGSASNIAEAASLGCDAFVTGEPREDTLAFATELGIALYAAGHHATERAGIRALGEHLGTKHDLRHVFLDVDNPV